MSLIAIAQRVRGDCPRARALLAIITVTGGIILGLLGMHSLSTHADPSGHHGTVTADTSAVTAETSAVTVSAAHHVSDARGAISDAADAVECLDCGDDRAMAWMACVLALLAAVVLFARSRLGWHASVVGHDSHTLQAQRPARAQALSPPPSLTVLCISRT